MAHLLKQIITKNKIIGAAAIIATSTYLYDEINQYNNDNNNKEVEFSAEQLMDLDLAYAISIHKSQGSEYPGVIIPVTREHSFMLSRNLLYTAITRGKQQVLMVGQSAALKLALNRVMADKRYTNLSQVLPKI